MSDGDFASIQVVTVGDSGSALYNCADIRFKKDAKGPSNCTSESEYFAVKEQTGEEEEQSNQGNSSNSDSKESGNDNAAGILGANMVALTSVAGLAAAFVMGIGL